MQYDQLVPWAMGVLLLQQQCGDPDAIRILVSHWPRRSGVRRPEFYDDNFALDPSLADYPVKMVPFADHPAFEKAPECVRQEVLTWAWLAYNQRVIEIEHLVTNPAINSLLYGLIPGADEGPVRQALRQTMIDEQFHLLMHELAMQDTAALRNIERPLDCEHSIVYRQLKEHQAASTEPWQRNMLRLIWSIVSELTINSYLRLLATADDVQPMHRQINSLHNNDEAAHNKIFFQISNRVFRHLSDEQREFFAAAVAKAIAAFTSHDISAWAAVLDRVRLPGRAEVLGDCEAEALSGRSKLISDISGVRQLVSELDVGPLADAHLAPLL